jgi:ankyrin repeat protein
MTSIFELIDAGDAAGIRTLLARDPGAAAQKDEQGLTVVMRAAYRGLTEAVLEADPPLEPFDRIVVGKSDGLPAPDAWTPDGFTGLHIAAFVDNVDAARKLLDAGADPNALATASFARVTPLGTCSFAGALDVAKVLLERGADPRIGEDGEYTAEAEAIARGNDALAALIREHTT